MDEALAVHRVGDTLVVGVPDHDDVVGSLRPGRELTCVVITESAHAEAAALDPRFVAAVERATSGDLCVVARGFGAERDGRPAPAAGLAEHLGVAVVAPVALPVGLPDGSLFVPGDPTGWRTFRPGGTVEPVGARLPAPWWQAGAARAAGHPVHVPSGLWLRRPDAPQRPDDPLWQAIPDLDRMFVVIGAPGESPPSADTVAATVRSLPDEDRDRAVLACYGSPAAGIAQQVAELLGAPIRVAHGVPRGDGLWYVDRTGTARWRPFAVQSVYRPRRAPALDRWVAPPGLAMAEPGSYRLTAGWRVDVVPRGLAVHPESTALDRAMLAASTGPTAEVLVASGGALPEPVRAALVRLIGALAPEVRANLQVLPVDQPAEAALADLDAFDVVGTRPELGPPSGPVHVAADGRVHAGAGSLPAVATLLLTEPAPAPRVRVVTKMLTADDRVAELAAVRAFVEDPAAPRDAEFAARLADGLGRLPAAPGVVVRALPGSTRVAPGSVLRLPAPVLAAPASVAAIGATEALIWTTTARALDGPLDERVLPGHVTLRVLAVDGGPVPRVLLTEDTTEKDTEKDTEVLAWLRAVAGTRVTEPGPTVARWFGPLPAA